MVQSLHFRLHFRVSVFHVDKISSPYMLLGQSLRSGCLIHNGTYLALYLTLTITLTLLTNPNTRYRCE